MGAPSSCIRALRRTRGHVTSLRQGEKVVGHPPVWLPVRPGETRAYVDLDSRPMARIGYVGQGNNLRRILNHTPEIAAAYWALRKALNDHSLLSPKLRILSFLSSDKANRCVY